MSGLRRVFTSAPHRGHLNGCRPAAAWNSNHGMSQSPHVSTTNARCSTSAGPSRLANTYRLHSPHRPLRSCHGTAAPPRIGGKAHVSAPSVTGPPPSARVQPEKPAPRPRPRSHGPTPYPRHPRTSCGQPGGFAAPRSVLRPRARVPCPVPHSCVPCPTHRDLCIPRAPSRVTPPTPHVPPPTLTHSTSAGPRSSTLHPQWYSFLWRSGPGTARLTARAFLRNCRFFGSRTLAWRPVRVSAARVAGQKQGSKFRRGRC
jgi:hypothetical protein